jgi:hypothetical protein
VQLFDKIEKTLMHSKKAEIVQFRLQRMRINPKNQKLKNEFWKKIRADNLDTTAQRRKWLKIAIILFTSTRILFFIVVMI